MLKAQQTVISGYTKCKKSDKNFDWGGWGQGYLINKTKSCNWTSVRTRGCKARGIPCGIQGFSFHPGKFFPQRGNRPESKFCLWHRIKRPQRMTSYFAGNIIGVNTAHFVLLEKMQKSIHSISDGRWHKLEPQPWQKPQRWPFFCFSTLFGLAACG